MIREFHQVDLSARNSFHVKQSATHLVEFECAEDLKQLFAQGIPSKWAVLSGGNNILFTKDYDGTLLTPCADKIEVVAQTADTVTVRATAGVEWDRLVAWAVEHELWGIENLSAIPGKVGAAPVQNIGAYGVEVKDTILQVETFCLPTCNELILSKEHCAFGYRDSVFKHALRGRAIILAVLFVLSRRPQPRLGYGDLQREVERLGGATLQHIRSAVQQIRGSKLPDPNVMGNAGSFFKNPIVDVAVVEQLKQHYPQMPSYATADSGKMKLAAGWLIEQAGMKGYVTEHVGVHDRQALVLVNRGGATGADVLALAQEVQQRVFAKFGVQVEMEVNIL
jgi:UDP-N-acetylmuramate dehydrogenase